MISLTRGSDQPLSRRYDVAMLDLDGVVYVGPDAVPGVPEALEQARAQGAHLAFVTNNAARPPGDVAAHLTRLGVAAQADEVITSAQAAARYLAEHLPGGADVLVLGTTGLVEALTERGLHPVSADGDAVQAVVQGYSPEMNWRLLAEGCVAIRRGLPWVATNVDPTVPSPRGPLPGNGSLVAALRLATGTVPVVTGKPDPTMHRETLLRTGARTPFVVGDRLDTDIEGANAVGCDSVLVLSGVTTVPDLLVAPARHRPTYLGRDAATVLHAHPRVDVETELARCGSWEVASPSTGSGTELAVRRTTGAASGADDELDLIRALCVAAWQTADRDGADAARGPQPPGVTGTDDDARRALQQVGLG